MSVIHSNLVKGSSITKLGGLTVGNNDRSQNVVEQIVVTVTLGCHCDPGELYCHLVLLSTIPSRLSACLVLTCKNAVDCGHMVVGSGHSTSSPQYQMAHKLLALSYVPRVIWISHLEGLLDTIHTVSTILIAPMDFLPNSNTMCYMFSKLSWPQSGKSASYPVKLFQLPDLSELEKTKLITLLNEYCDVYAPTEGPSVGG